MRKFIFSFFAAVLPLCGMECQSSFSDSEWNALLDPSFYSEWFASADFLWWRAREEGLKFGPTTLAPVEVSDQIDLTVYKKPRKSFNWRYHSGFRFGIGCANRLSGWILESYWTHLQGTNSAKYYSNRSHWDFKFNTLDAQLGRQYHLNRNVELKFFAGLEAGWISQNRTSHLLNQLLTPHTRYLYDYYSKDRSSYGGLGPKLGGSIDWYLCKGFSLYLAGSGSALLGKFNVHHREDIDALDETSLKDSRDASFSRSQSGYASSQSDHHNSWRMQYLLEGAAGIRWTGLFYNDIDAFVFLGYEYHRIFDQNKIGNSGDLIFDGLTLSFTISI